MQFSWPNQPNGEFQPISGLINHQLPSIIILFHLSRDLSPSFLAMRVLWSVKHTFWSVSLRSGLFPNTKMGGLYSWLLPATDTYPWHSFKNNSYTSSSPSSSSSGTFFIFFFPPLKLACLFRTYKGYYLPNVTVHTIPTGQIRRNIASSPCRSETLHLFSLFKRECGDSRYHLKHCWQFSSLSVYYLRAHTITEAAGSLTETPRGLGMLRIISLYICTTNDKNVVLIFI